MCSWYRFCITPGFWFLLAVIAAGCAGSVLPAVLAGALCHELGHLAALRAVGAKVERVRLTAFGVEIGADTRYLPYGREILCVLAGPVVSVALALVCARVLSWYTAAGVNLILGVYNLLPVASLDGGRALHLALCWALGPYRGDALCRWISLGATVLLTAAAGGLVLHWGAGGYLFLTAVGLLLPQLPLDKLRGNR